MIGCLPTVKNSQLRSAKNSQFRKRRGGDHIGLTIALIFLPEHGLNIQSFKDFPAPRGAVRFRSVSLRWDSGSLRRLVSGTIGLAPLQHRYRFKSRPESLLVNQNKLLAIETNLLPNQASVCRQMSALSVSTFMFRVIVTVLGLELLTACVGNRPYRLGGIADEFYPNQKPPFEQSTVSADRNYRLSFVEFDERGDFWDRRQLGEASRAIRASEKPTLLVMFIHGWHHNANDRKQSSKNPGDVETFRCLLSELAVSESLRGFQVHGVFLGWRGRSCRTARLLDVPRSERSCHASRGHPGY